VRFPVIESSVAKIVREVPDDALLLDVGGWGKPFTRADWVLDQMPHETRGLYGSDGDGEERFSRETWVCRDICDREPWPFADNQFDFVVCSHTLEDVRDPVWVCHELTRVGKAGYIEVPSRLEEQSYGVHGPWVGWGHHHWLVDIEPGRVRFSFKHHVLHNRATDHFPPGFHERLSEEDRIQRLWWQGGFDFEEQVFTTQDGVDSYLADFVALNLRARPLPPPPRPRYRHRLQALARRHRD
jgi:hypothetical protein